MQSSLWATFDFSITFLHHDARRDTFPYGCQHFLVHLLGWTLKMALADDRLMANFVCFLKLLLHAHSLSLWLKTSDQVFTRTKSFYRNSWLTCVTIDKSHDWSAVRMEISAVSSINTALNQATAWQQHTSTGGNEGEQAYIRFLMVGLFNA